MLHCLCNYIQKFFIYNILLGVVFLPADSAFKVSLMAMYSRFLGPTPLLDIRHISGSAEIFLSFDRIRVQQQTLSVYYSKNSCLKLQWFIMQGYMTTETNLKKISYLCDT